MYIVKFPVYDKEDIFFANAEIKENSDKSELLQLFLRKNAFEDAKFPEISKAVKYFKETEGGRSEVCKTVENYVKITYQFRIYLFTFLLDKSFWVIPIIPSNNKLMRGYFAYEQKIK